MGELGYARVAVVEHRVLSLVFGTCTGTGTSTVTEGAVRAQKGSCIWNRSIPNCTGVGTGPSIRVPVLA